MPIGVGVHTGIAFVGSVGVDANVDLTAMGDPVNVTARLASAAGPGEALVTVEAAQAGNLDESGHRATSARAQRQEQGTHRSSYFARRPTDRGSGAAPAGLYPGSPARPRLGDRRVR